MASRGFPSMTVLLGLLAVAGYQNRDRITGMLRGNQGSAQGSGSGEPSGGHEPDMPGAQTGGLGGLLGSLGGAGAGGLLSRGLGELMERFQQTGHRETADSWVGAGPNLPIDPRQLQQAIGEDTLAELSARTGLPREELIARLSRELPDAVDRYTPEGRLPDPDGDGIPDQPGPGRMPRRG